MSSTEACQRLCRAAQEAGRRNKGLRATWPLLARDMLALLGGLRRAAMLDYAHCLSLQGLATAVQQMLLAVAPAGG